MKIIFNNKYVKRRNTTMSDLFDCIPPLGTLILKILPRLNSPVIRNHGDPVVPADGDGPVSMETV